MATTTELRVFQPTQAGLRPSYVLRPQLSRQYDSEGEEFYMAEFDCLFVCGPTPEAAYQAFDKAWLGQEWCDDETAQAL
jgi:hypothetical protein